MVVTKHNGNSKKSVENDSQEVKAMKKDMKTKATASFTRKINSSDAVMYATKWDGEHSNEEVSLRVSTVSKPFSPARDICSLPSDMDTLVVKCNVKFLGNIGESCTCNVIEISNKINHNVADYIERTGVKELASRYAHNIASARFLGKNRIGAENIAVVIEADDLKLTVNAYDYPLRNFEHSDELEPLVEKIAKALAGKDKFLTIKVKAYAQLGYQALVYPSKEWLSNQDNNKSVALFNLGEVAALHSQQIDNAIRTIDTWYDGFGTDDGIGPLAVNPYGASRSHHKNFRNISDGTDFYTLLNKFVDGESLSESEEHFVIAMLICGGKFKIVSKSALS